MEYVEQPASLKARSISGQTASWRRRYSASWPGFTFITNATRSMVCLKDAGRHEPPRIRFTLEVQLVDVVGLEDKRGSEQDDTVGVDGVVTESARGEFLAWVALDLALHKQRRRVVGKVAEVLDIPQRELLAGAVFDEGPHQVRCAEAGQLDLAGLAGLLEDLSGS